MLLPIVLGIRKFVFGRAKDEGNWQVDCMTAAEILLLSSSRIFTWNNCWAKLIELHYALVRSLGLCLCVSTHNAKPQNSWPVVMTAATTTANLQQCISWQVKPKYFTAARAASMSEMQLELQRQPQRGQTGHRTDNTLRYKHWKKNIWKEVT